MIQYKVPLELRVTIELDAENLACALQRAVVIALRRFDDCDMDRVSVCGAVEVKNGDNAES